MSEEHQESTESTEGAGEQQQETQQQTNGAEIEAKARDMGWVSQEEWKGDPEVWRPADEFVRRGEEFLPIVRSQLKKSQEQVAELTKQVASHADTVKRIERMNEAALKRQRAQIEDEYNARKVKAVETGDTDAYNAAVKAEKQALTDLEKETKPEPAKAYEPPPEVKAWVEENPWFANDKRLARHAARFLDDVMEDMPAASTKEQLAEVRERMAEAYPDKFGVKKGNGSSRVEGGQKTSGGGAARGKRAADLPEEAKTAAKRFIEQGIYKSVDEYAVDYWKEDA